MGTFKHSGTCEIVAVPQMISMSAVPCPSSFISFEDAQTLSREACNETVNTRDAILGTGLRSSHLNARSEIYVHFLINNVNTVVAVCYEVIYQLSGYRRVIVAVKAAMIF